MNYTITSTVPLAVKLDSINEQNLNWLPLIELLNLGCTPQELAQSLLSLYFCITDAMTAFPEEISTENLRTDLMQLRILYYAINDMGLHSEAKIG